MMPRAFANIIQNGDSVLAHPRNIFSKLLKRLALPAFYLAAAAVVLGVNPFKGQTTTPFDLLVSQKAWEFVDPGVHVRQGQRSDTLNYFVPMWTVARNQIRAGKFPLWNDKVAGGGPFLSVSTGLFTPAFLIFAAIPDPALGFYVAMLFNLAIAGLGMHLLLRRHVRLLASVTGALTFEFCGFNAAWLYWPHVFTIIWAPWLLWSIHQCRESPGARQGFGLAVSTALVCLGGFPFVSVVVLEAGTLYALVLWPFGWRSAQRSWPFALWYVTGTCLGLLIAVIPLLGLVFWLQQFDIGYRYGRGSYLNLHYWKQLFPPWAWEARRVEQTMYVGAAMVVLAFGALVACLACRRQFKPLPLFSVLLLIITGALVFGLWPMWLIGWMPGMAYNSWSRAIGVMDISLIVLGAFALDWLWRRATSMAHTEITCTAVLVLAIVQIVEMGLFFRAWNGPVPNRYYFPSVPTVTYMKQRAGPFDYVITDNSFLMSGTLEAYGLREWLGHYFRSPALQHALHKMAKHPFNSHVASPSKFPAEDVKYQSPEMASFNVRYVAIDSSHDPISDAPIAPVESGRHVALPPMPAHDYTQRFTLKQGGISMEGISVRLATYRESDLPGTVTLTLRDVDGTTIRVARNDASNIVDNTYFFFAFRTPVTLDAGQYEFSIHYARPATSDLRLTAWTFAQPTPAASLLVDGKPYPGNIDFKLYVASDGPFRRVFASGRTAVLENTRSPDGPYFLPKVSDLPNGQSSAHMVRVESYEPARFTLRYTGNDAGVVVVPMTANADWYALVNGVQVDYQLKDGVMPAVPVAGPSVISFQYHPRALNWWPEWLAVLIGSICGMLWIDHCLRRHATP
jgi:hypothetical protein